MAGDINKPGIVEQLEQYAPLYVVRGNNDKEWAEQLPHDRNRHPGGRDLLYGPQQKGGPGGPGRGRRGGVRPLPQVSAGGEGRRSLAEPRLLRAPGGSTQEITMMMAEAEDGKLQVEKIVIPHEAT